MCEITGSAVRYRASMEKLEGRLVGSKSFDHVESGDTTVYDRHSYVAERRQTLVRWAGKVNEILGRSRESAKVARIA